jgi:RimJ/RimL family protein N-acetyltransferase
MSKDIILPIITSRLILTDFTMNDVKDVVKIGERMIEQTKNDPDYLLFFWFRPKQGETQFENIKRRIESSIQNSKIRPRINYSLALRLKESNKLIGRFCIDMDGIGDTGSFIDPEYQKNGYQSEARIAMMDLYFERFPVLTATADPDNVPSNKNLIGFGGILSGTKDASEFDGRPRNIYKITKENYKKACEAKMKKMH